MKFIDVFFYLLTIFCQEPTCVTLIVLCLRLCFRAVFGTSAQNAHIRSSWNVVCFVKVAIA